METQQVIVLLFITFSHSLAKYHLKFRSRLPKKETEKMCFFFYHIFKSNFCNLPPPARAAIRQANINFINVACLLMRTANTRN